MLYQDTYMARDGVLLLDVGSAEFLGPFGRMAVPYDTYRRAFRLYTKDVKRQPYEYMASWCARKSQAECEAK